MSDIQPVSVPSRGKESNNLSLPYPKRGICGKVSVPSRGKESNNWKLLEHISAHIEHKVSVPPRGEESNNLAWRVLDAQFFGFPSPLGAKSPTICIAANGTCAGLMRWFPSPLGVKSPTTGIGWLLSLVINTEFPSPLRVKSPTT